MVTVAGRGCPAGLGWSSGPGGGGQGTWARAPGRCRSRERRKNIFLGGSDISWSSRAGKTEVPECNKVYTRLELLNNPWSLLSDSPLHDAAYIWTAGRQKVIVLMAAYICLRLLLAQWTRAEFRNTFFFAWYNFKLHFLMQRWAVLSDNDFPKYSWAHVAMSIIEAWWFLKQYRLRAW